MAGRKSHHGYDGKIAGLYDLEETIGRGHFAVVKLARHVFTGEKVAVKVIDKTKLDEVSRSHLFQEVRCMKLVQHPNVVRLYEVIDTQTKLYLILELGDGGDMYDYIMKHSGGLEEKLSKRYFRQIVEAISYCHKLHVVHRDLKPENVVFFEKLGLVKLTDFGFSNMFAPGKKLETSCGSLAYSAPEILLGDSYDAPAVDVWSLGVILYMLVVGEAPFQEANDSETLTMIMDCRYHVPPHISEKCRDLIGKMLQREPVSRASLPHILAHPWLNDGDLTPVASYLPLITKEMISEEDHNCVVQKMVEGKIASRDEILTSIDKNSYNHITATFYLLVERRLRKHQQHEYHLLQQQPSSGYLRKQSAPSPSRSAKPHLEPLMLSPRQQRELKKTKTAPIPPAHIFTVGPPSPSILVSPPVDESTTSPGPYFVKSLTTSMTLDRRKSGKKQQAAPPLSLGPRAPHRKASAPGGEKGGPRKLSVSGGGDHSPRLVRKNIQMSKSDPGAGSRKTPSAPVSKIALLSSFFERKAKEAASGDRNPRLRMGWLTARNRRPNAIRQRVLETLETPISPPAAITSVASSQNQSFKHECVERPPPPPSLPVPVLQPPGSMEKDVGSSHYVQALTSPPAGPPPPSSLPKGQQHTLSSPQSDSNLLAPPGHVVGRKCSLIQEESLDEYDDEDDEDVEFDTATIKPVKSLESLESLDELGGPGGMVTLVPVSPTLTAPPPAAVVSVDSVNPRRPLKSVCSSPQLLNQIHEENESEDENDVLPLKLSTPRRFAGSSASRGHHGDRGGPSPQILRKYDQRKKGRGSGQRGTSCSSSDASDTDEADSRSGREKLQHKFLHRRDSSDHSSDTDGPGGNLGTNGRLATGGRHRANSSGGTRHTQGGNGRGNRGGGKSGGGGGGGGNEKKNSDNRNHSNNKNSQHHGGGSGGSNKGSQTESRLKLLSRKLTEISTGVGALLSECRGGDCDDSPVHKPPSMPSWVQGAVRCEASSLQRHSGHCSSDVSCRHSGHSSSDVSCLHSRHSGDSSSDVSCLHGAPVLHTDPSNLNQQFFPPVHYVGHSFHQDSLGAGGQRHLHLSQQLSQQFSQQLSQQFSQQFSQLSQCVWSSDGDGGGWELGVVPSSLHDHQSPCPRLLHCPPAPVALVPGKSKCCSLV